MNTRAILSVSLCAALTWQSNASPQMVFNFEPTSPLEIDGDAGFFNGMDNPNSPDSGSGFGNAFFSTYAPLEFVNVWVTPANSTFPASDGGFKLQTFAGPGADTVLRANGRPIATAEFTLTSGGFATITYTGSLGSTSTTNIPSNPGSFGDVTADSAVLFPGEFISEIRFQSFGSPPAGFFAIDRLELTFPPGETFYWSTNADDDFDAPQTWTVQPPASWTPGKTPPPAGLLGDSPSLVFPSFETPVIAASRSGAPGSQNNGYTVRRLPSETTVERLEVLGAIVTFDFDNNRSFTVTESFNLDELTEAPVGGGTLRIIDSNPIPSPSLRTGLTLPTTVYGLPGDPQTDDPFSVPGGVDLLLDEGSTLESDTGQLIVAQDARLGMTSPPGTNIDQFAPAIRNQVLILQGERGEAGAPVPGSGTPGRLIVRGECRITGDVNNSGDLVLDLRSDGTPGTLAVGPFIGHPNPPAYDYTQSPDGLLEVVLGPNQSGSGVDGAATVLEVSGTATIDGTLRISRAPGYNASAGDVFTILTANTLDIGDQGGFRFIENMLDTGRQDLFWGVDYNTRFDGMHMIQVVALRRPTIVNPDGSRRPLSMSSDAARLDHIVMISHGTAGTLEPASSPDVDLDEDEDALAEVAQGFARFASSAPGLNASEWGVVALEWREFATNGNPRVSFLICGDGSDDCCGDSRVRGFDPYEAARFGQQYARAVLFYLREIGINPGDLSTMHTLGHSSGSYVADFLPKLLANNHAEPRWLTEEGTPLDKTPDDMHVTLFDTFLSPQTGESRLDFCRDWDGPAIGELGFEGADFEQYFNDDAAYETNNRPALNRDQVINFNVSLYPSNPVGGGDGHSFPQRFYRDSINWFLNDPASDPIEPVIGVTQTEVFTAFGAVFSPMMNRAGQGLSLSTVSNSSQGEVRVVEDVRRVVDYRKTPVYETEFSVGGDFVTLDPSRVSLRGPSPSPNGIIGVLGTSPMGQLEGELSGPVEEAHNSVSFTVHAPNAVGGRLSVLVDGEVFSILELEEIGATQTPTPIDPVAFPMRAAGPITISFAYSGPIDTTGIEISDLAIERAFFRLNSNDCLADFDGDGDVDLTDFGTFGSAFNSVVGDPNYDPRSDYDNNGAVDIVDFGTFVTEFGRSDCPQ